MLADLAPRRPAQLWGDSDLEWQAQPANNREGGLICIWKRGIFSLQECVSGPVFLGLIGAWGSEGVSCEIVNVYSPCNLEEKRSLWANL